MFKILSIDGGGIRGVFAASFLAELERRLDEPLGRYFDLIAGTSTGGLIALALGSGRTANQICQLYRDHSHEIFKSGDSNRDTKRLSRAYQVMRPFFPAALRSVSQSQLNSVFQPRYQADSLAIALEGEFGDTVLEDADRRLIIPSVDLCDGKTCVFKTPHLPGLIRDRHYRLVDIALATSAAPTYFPAHAIQAGHAFVDGGLWANNPAMIAYAEAAKIARACTRDEDRPFQLNEIVMLSLGTGLPSYSSMPGANAGLAWWGPRLLETMMTAQSQGISFQANYVMGDNHVRCNFMPEDSSWSLDALDKMDRLERLGQQRAAEFWTPHHNRFFDAPAPHPVWFGPAT